MKKIGFLLLFFISGAFVGGIYLGGFMPALLFHARMPISISNGVSLESDGDYLYVTDGTAFKYSIIGLDNPKNPTLLSEIPFSAEIYCSHISNNIAYFCIGAQGVENWDLSDPANPTKIAYLSMHIFSDWAFSTGYVYCAGGGSQIQCYNISQLNQFDYVGYTYWRLQPGQFPITNPLQLADSHLFFANSESVEIYDIATPTAIVHLSSTSYIYEGSLNLIDYTIQDSKIFLITSARMLHIIDVSNPQSLVELGRYSLLWDPKSITVHDNVAYVAFMENYGISIIDVANPAKPISRGFFQAYPQSNIIVAKDFICVIDNSWGLVLFNPNLVSLGWLNIIVLSSIFYFGMIFLQPPLKKGYNLLRANRRSRQDQTFRKNLERAASAGVASPFSYDDKSLLEQFQKLMGASNKVGIKHASAYLGIPDDVLVRKVVDWAVQLPIKIDGEWLLIDNMQSFMDTLDSQFMAWGEKEETKVGKTS